MSEESSESFWNFSVRTYRQPNVPEACLSLQNEEGVDVNMLLFCCWFSMLHGKFENGTWDQAAEFSTLWSDNVVRPLRVTRTWMKTAGCRDVRVPFDACMQFRDEVKSVEFSAEKMQQEILESLCASIEAAMVDESSLMSSAAENIHRYLLHLGVTSTAQIEDRLQTIVAAAFPQVRIEEFLQARRECGAG